MTTEFASKDAFASKEITQQNKQINHNMEILEEANKMTQQIKTALLCKKRTDTNYVRCMLESIKDYKAELDSMKFSNIFDSINFDSELQPLRKDSRTAQCQLAHQLVNYLTFLSKYDKTKISNIVDKLNLIINDNMTHSQPIYGSVVKFDAKFGTNDIKQDQQSPGKKCECGAKCDFLSEFSELVCPDCGLVQFIISTPYRELDSEYSVKKIISSEPIRHFKFWVECLQGDREIKISEKEEAQLLINIRRDKITKSALTYNMMREYLKSTKLTKYNNYVVYLVYKYTGRKPRRISPEDYREMSTKFNLAMEIYSKLNDEHGNRPYYPHTIYKLIEHKFKKKYQEILDAIHLQSRETTVKNDNSWKMICEWNEGELGIKFHKTNYVEATRNHYI